MLVPVISDCYIVFVVLLAFDSVFKVELTRKAFCTVFRNVDGPSFPFVSFSFCVYSLLGEPITILQ